MTCEELLAALNEYVDSEAAAGVCEAFKEHLRGCNLCQVVVDNIRGTITLYKAGEPYELPPEFHEGLCRLLKARWRAKFPGAKV